MSKLIFLRHGCRQLNVHKQTPEPGDPSRILKLAADENLNLFGHIYSYNVGKFIKKNFPKPDIVYSDVTDLRTIDTSISMSLGMGNDFISLSKSNPDLFFNPEIKADDKSLAKSKKLLDKYNDTIQEIKQIMECIIPCLTLED